MTCKRYHRVWLRPRCSFEEKRLRSDTCLSTSKRSGHGARSNVDDVVFGHDIDYSRGGGAAPALGELKPSGDERGHDLRQWLGNRPVNAPAKNQRSQVDEVRMEDSLRAPFYTPGASSPDL